MSAFLWSGLWSNHPKPKLIWGVKVICTVWNRQYKKSGKKPRSPHALSQVPKGKSLPNIPVLFSQICHLWLTTPPPKLCLIVPSRKRLPLRGLVKSPISHFTGSRDYTSQPVSSSSRPRISTLSNPRAGTTHNQNSGHGIQRTSKQERKQQKMGEYAGNAWCCKLQRLNRSCSHLKHSHTVTLQLHCCLDILCYTEHMLIKECLGVKVLSLSKDDLMAWTQCERVSGLFTKLALSCAH